MKRITFLTIIAFLATWMCCDKTQAQGTIDLLNYNACTVKLYDWDYGSTDGQNYGWYLTQRYNADGSRHKIITTANATGSDPNVPISDLPAGETTALRLGTANYNTTYGYDDYGNIYVESTEMAKGGGVAFTYQVTQENAILFLKYAALLTDPMEDHYTALSNLIGQPAWNPYFNDYSYIGAASMFEDPTDWQYQQPFVQVYLGIDGQEQACATKHHLLYDVAGNAVSPGDDWKATSFDIPDEMVYYHYDAYYKPWSVIAINLTPYIGHTVSLGVEYRDCAMAGWYYFEEDEDYGFPQIFTCDDHHLARVYLHASCSPNGDGQATPSAIAKVKEDCLNQTVTYSAPEGFSSYRWFTSNNRNLTLSNSQTCSYTFASEDEETYLFCTVTSKLTAGCSDEETTLQLAIKNTCSTPELEYVSETCEPQQTITYKAPVGYAGYRWFSSYNRSLTLSTTQSCTYTFSEEGEELDLYCELTTTGGVKNVLSQHIVNTCVNKSSSKVVIPAYVCADSKVLRLELNYTKGSPLSYDITFDEAAQQAGFANATNVAISQANTNPYYLDIPMPAASPYVRPDRYTVTNITIHQEYNKDTTFRFGFYVYYPTWVLSQKWDDVIAVKNTNNNGGYEFSAIRWYHNGESIQGEGALNSYIYVPSTFVTGDKYWAELTRQDDGKTYCTCPLTIAAKGESSAPERKESVQIQSGSNKNEMNITAATAGSYTIYNVIGLWIGEGRFEQGQSSIRIPGAAQGAYLFMFRLDDGREESKKVLFR